MPENAYIEESVEERCNNRSSISKLIEMYISDLRKHNYSGKTVYSYRQSLENLLSFLDAEGVREISDVTSCALEKYRGWRLSAGMRPGTVALNVGVIKTFFGYLDGEGVIFDNPALGLKAPRDEKRMGHVPSEEDMGKLLARPDVSTAMGIRDRAILEVAYSTGIRLGELTGLRLSSVDLKNKTLRVFGKGRRERIAPLTRAAAKWLEKYLSGPRGELLKYNLDEDALWIGTHRRMMSHAALGVRIGGYSKAAGVRRISPHAIRRACATHMLRNGAHPVQIQMLLGHSEMRTLSRYISVNLGDVRKTHAKSGPGR